MIAVEQLQQAIASARPGTVIEVVFRITVPDSESPGPNPKGGEMAPAAEHEADAGPKVLEIDPARRTPAQRVEAWMAEHGEDERKERDWAADICSHKGFSGRELEKALKSRAIPWTPKLDGKDAGARMVRGRDIIAYLELRERVRAGETDAPEWWEDVVSARKRAA